MSELSKENHTLLSDSGKLSHILFHALDVHKHTH